MDNSRATKNKPPNKEVVTRIAPSPTGNLHVGTLRTALFNYLVAKKYGGKFLLRIEDTDKERSKKEFEDDILEGFRWASITYDGLVRQSERKAIYASYIKRLIKNGDAYVSKEPKKDTPNVEVEIIRFKNPKKRITFTDLIRGEITFDTTELGDFVIARSLTEPFYHIAVVIDDFEMGVTHVIRGEDHISNTPRQILIQEALGFKRPKYAHLPLILASDKSKLSKRNSATSVTDYKQNYFPHALLNYLALLGWNPGTDQELFSLSELVDTFDISKVQKGGAVFDEEKLKSINHEYIKKSSESVWNKIVRERLPDKITSHPAFNDTLLTKISKQLKERVAVFEEIRVLGESGELDFYVDAPKYNSSNLVYKDDAPKYTKRRLEKLLSLLELVSKDQFEKTIIKETVWDYAEKEGRGSVLWPMRFALTGLQKSPDPFIVAEILGKREVLERLKKASERL